MADEIVPLTAAPAPEAPKAEAPKADAPKAKSELADAPKKKKKPGVAPRRGKKLRNLLRNVEKKVGDAGTLPVKAAVTLLKLLVWNPAEYGVAFRSPKQFACVVPTTARP